MFKAGLAALEMLHLSGLLTDQAKRTLDELGDMNKDLKARQNSPNAALRSQLNQVQNDGAILQDLLVDLSIALHSDDIETDSEYGNEAARECVMMIQEYFQRMFSNVHLVDLSRLTTNSNKLATARQITHVLNGVVRQYSDLLSSLLNAVGTWRLENEDVGQRTLQKLRNMNPNPLAPDNPRAADSGSAMADFTNLVQELGTNKFENVSSG